MELLEHWFYGSVIMLWETFWALTLGFGLSAVLQVFVPKENVQAHFGTASLKSVGLATFFGAASSSCSYAAAAASKTAFKKGADLVPTLAFMFASTNLVLELGIVLWILLGWHFVLAEFVGSFVLIGIMWLLVRLTLPKGLQQKAREALDKSEDGESDCCGHSHGHHDHRHHDQEAQAAGKWVAIGDAFLMDVSMMWKEIVIGFLIAGFLMAAIPMEWWQILFLPNLPWPVQLVENAVVGVLIAVVSFVCSVGNLPLASLLWSGGISFGGVISFIYADLIIVPLLVMYRKYYGLKAAAYISVVLFVSMVLAGIVVDLLFTLLDLVPKGIRPPSLMQTTQFAWNYTTWLDLVALVAIGFLFVVRVLSKASSYHEMEQKPNVG
jgi:uncharacterized membrane protein YraQ (UPF0718 family)